MTKKRHRSSSFNLAPDEPAWFQFVRRVHTHYVDKLCCENNFCFKGGVGHVFSYITWSRHTGRQRHLGPGLRTAANPCLFRARCWSAALKATGISWSYTGGPWLHSYCPLTYIKPAVCDDKLCCRGSQYRLIKYNVYLCGYIMWYIMLLLTCILADRNTGPGRIYSFLVYTSLYNRFFSAPWSTLSIFSNKDRLNWVWVLRLLVHVWQARSAKH